GGCTSRASPGRIVPPASVPVTTTPRPFRWNARSTGRRAGRSGSAGTAWREARSTRAALSSGIPCPVALDTGRIGAPENGVPARSSPTSSSASSRRSGVTRSTLVSATRPEGMPRSEQTARCSRVCGFTPSSAATTRSITRMPPRPARALWRNRSCPGTSTKPIWRSPSKSQANPRSMVIPRAFSSAQRSQSIPVSARTRLVLPWSMWPAVPAMALLIACRASLAREHLARDPVDRGAVRGAAEAGQHLLHDRTDRRRAGEPARGHQLGDRGADLPLVHLGGQVLGEECAFGLLLPRHLLAPALVEAFRRLLPLLDRLADESDESRLVHLFPLPADALVLDLGQQHPQSAQLVLLARLHGGLHVGFDALLRCGRGHEPGL